MVGHKLIECVVLAGEVVVGGIGIPFLALTVEVVDAVDVFMVLLNNKGVE